MDKSRTKENAAGIGGAALSAPWVFTGVCRVIDWISRGQTTMTVVPHLDVLMNPLAFLAELVGAVGLLFYATRLEHRREADEVPLIILPYTEPPKQKRHWFWLKLAIIAASLAAASAVAIYTVPIVRETASRTFHVERPTPPPLPSAWIPLARKTPPSSPTIAHIEFSAKLFSGNFLVWSHGLNTLTPAVSCYNSEGDGVSMGLKIKGPNAIILEAVPGSQSGRCVARK